MTRPTFEDYTNYLAEIGVGDTLKDVNVKDKKLAKVGKHFKLGNHTFIEIPKNVVLEKKFQVEGFLKQAEDEGLDLQDVILFSAHDKYTPEAFFVVGDDLYVFGAAFKRSIMPSADLYYNDGEKAQKLVDQLGDAYSIDFGILKKGSNSLNPVFADRTKGGAKVLEKVADTMMFLTRKNIIDPDAMIINEPTQDNPKAKGNARGTLYKALGRKFGYDAFYVGRTNIPIQILVRKGTAKVKVARELSELERVGSER